MAKTKRNKKGMAERVAGKTKAPPKLNPFDVRFVKDKQKVLGKKNRNDVGKPGITRAKAIQKRKETLLQEYKLKNKTNMFLDKRIGEKDSNLSSEDKMIARFTAERMRGSGKSSIFNLGDDMNLTHGGEDLDDIDRFDDPKSDDEEQDELLGKKFVDEAHFGGFMSQSDDAFKAGRGNSRKEVIEQLIRESKIKKAEKRKADEAAEEKTQDLDQSWKDLNRSMVEMKKTRDDAEEAKAKGNYDPYDMLVKSLGFEKKEARGGERLKTEDEKLKEEKERLEKLEEDRMRRMRGEKVTTRNHVSVEDTGEEGGKKKVKMSGKEKRKLMKQLLKGEKESGDEEGHSDKEAEGDEAAGEESEEEESEEESDEEEEEGEDGYSDLDDSDGEPDDEAVNEKDTYDEKVEEMKAAASAEIPFVIPIPASYDILCGLVLGRSPEDQAIVLDRILACNHPHLGQDTKPALLTHFGLLLQLAQDTALALDSPPRAPSALATLELLSPRLFRLAALFQQKAAEAVLQVIKEKFQEWTGLPRRRFPGMDTIVFLQLVHLLFPTSDYRHPVTTPSLTLLSSSLSLCRPTDRPSLASCLLLCSLALHYTALARRLSPELLGALRGLLYVAGKEHTVRPPPPCKGGALLLLTAPVSCPPSKLALTEAVSVKDVDDTFKVAVIEATLKLLQKVLELYRDLASAKELFAPFLPVLAAIPRAHYPPHVVTAFGEVDRLLGQLCDKAGGVRRPDKQVAMLRMMEPALEEDFEPGKKKRTGSKELLEEQKMRHKLKQERKGARKEIRQDNAFLASQRAKEARSKDEDRQERTKEIFSGLANQEGDYNKMLKKKKKKF